MNRLSAEELRAAQKAQNFRLLWGQTDHLCKFCISSMIKGGMDYTALDMDDVLQDAFEAAGKAVRTWDPDKGEFSTWVCRRVQGAIGDHIRRLRGGVCMTGPYDEERTASVQDDGEAQSSRAFEITLVRHLLSQVEDFDEYRVLRLRYGFDGEPQTIREIAKTIGRTPRHVHRVLKSIQTILSHKLEWAR